MIDLTDYGGEQFFLISLARIKFDSLGETFSCASLDKSWEERIRNMILIDLFLKRSRRISWLFVNSRNRLILWSGSILQPVLRLDQFVLIWRGTLWKTATCLAVLWLRCTHTQIFKVATLYWHDLSSSRWENSASIINNRNVFSWISTSMRTIESLISLCSRLKEYFAIFIKVKISNLKVEDHFILGSSAEFNESTEEISEDLLNSVLIDVAYEANSGRVDLNQTAFFFIFLNKIRSTSLPWLALRFW